MTTLAKGTQLHKAICTHFHPAFFCRNYATNQSQPIKPVNGIRYFITKKLSSFVEGYEHLLQTKFPRVFKVYQTFAVGTRELINDVTIYRQVSNKVRAENSIRKLTRKELEVYFKTPKELLKVSPLLFIAALPFTNYVVFPLMYFFPKQLLTPHFWSLEQKIEFRSCDLVKQLNHCRAVFRALQYRLDSIKDPNLHHACQVAFYKLGSGWHPTPQETFDLRVLFQDSPFGLKKLTSSHLRHLSKLHGLSFSWLIFGRKSRLLKHALFLHELDLAMRRDGINSMSLDELRNSCFLRGFSPLGLPKDDLIKHLKTWTNISSDLTENEMSLLLHCPVLLSYNQPSNWKLKICH